MLNRRSFFRRIAAIVAAVALAPEIAFGVKLPLLDLDELARLDLAYEANVTVLMEGATKRLFVYTSGDRHAAKTKRYLSANFLREV